jgi:hypothetical protein
MEWSDEDKRRLFRLGKKIYKSEKHHHEKNLKYSYRHNLLMGFSIFLGPLAGFLSGIGTTINPDTDILFPIMASATGFLSGLVIAYTKFSAYQDLASVHEQLSIRYKTLRMDIQHRVALRYHGVSLEAYMREVFGLLSVLYAGGPQSFVSKFQMATEEKTVRSGPTTPRRSDLLSFEMRRFEDKMKRYDSNVDSPDSGDLFKEEPALDPDP